jgi:transaldolase/glucose-6-phosphate isomerase
LFIQIVCDAAERIAIPGQAISFGDFIRAQALGDWETLSARGRRVLRVHLDRPEQISSLRKVLP